MRIYLFLWFVILCFSVFGKLVFDPSWSSNMQLVNQRLLRKCVLTFFFNFSASNARKVHQFAYSTHSLIEDWGLTTARRVCLCKKKKLYEPVCISWYMGTGDVFKALKIARAAGKCSLRTWVTIYHEMHDRWHHFIYIIFAKKLRRKSKDSTVTLLWTRNSVMASKLLKIDCFISTKQLQLCDRLTGKLSVNYF